RPSQASVKRVTSECLRERWPSRKALALVQRFECPSRLLPRERRGRRARRGSFERRASVGQHIVPASPAKADDRVTRNLVVIDQFTENDRRSGIMGSHERLAQHLPRATMLTFTEKHD